MLEHEVDQPVHAHLDVPDAGEVLDQGLLLDEPVAVDLYPEEVCGPQDPTSMWPRQAGNASPS